MKNTLTLFLLAMPYVVEISTVGKRCIEFGTSFECVKYSEQSETHELKADLGDGIQYIFSCRGTKEECQFPYDMADALNEANRRRREAGGRGAVLVR